MKRLLLVLFFGLSATLSAQTYSSDSGRLPGQATAIGGKGADGKFHYLSVNNDGTLGLDATGATITGSSDVTIHDGTTSSQKLAIDSSGRLTVLLPSGAATAAKQPALGTAGSASSDVITVQGIASGTAQPVSVASLPLPSGASTAAKQPALGTAGSASSDVITVQGKSGMTPVVVDGSGVTQPISGSVTVSGTATVSGSVTANPSSGTRVNSSAYETSHVLKASAGTLIHCSGYNSGPSQFILFFDSATVPANGSSAIKVLPVAAQSNFSTDVPLTGLPFATGISVSNSSTSPTKTIGSADVFYTAVIQ